MSTNVGSLVATLALRSEGFNSPLKEAEKNSARFAEVVDVSAKRAEAAFSRAAEGAKKTSVRPKKSSQEALEHDNDKDSRRATEGRLADAGAAIDGTRHKMSLAAFEMAHGLKMSETAAREFANTAEVQSKRAATALETAAKKSKMPGMFTQAGFAIQDFSSQLETRGLSGAIGAVTNNVQMLGMAFGPVGAAVTAIGAGIGGIVLPRMIDWISQTKSINEEIQAVNEKFDDNLNMRREIATLEVKGGAIRERQNWEDQLAVAEKLKAETGRALQVQINQLAFLKKERNALVQFASHEFLGMKIEWANDSIGARNFDNMIEKQKKIIEHTEQAFGKVLREQTHAAEKLRLIEPGTEAAKKDDWNEQVKLFDEGVKRQREMFEAERTLKKRILEEYGTESEKLESRLANERARHTLLNVNKEAMQRLDAIHAVERKRLAITEAEDKVAKMGSLNQSSAGAERQSVEGVRAINRAVAGNSSEQSLMKESIKTLKDQLKELQTIARAKVPQMVSLSGG